MSRSRFVITNGWRLLWIVRQLTFGRITMIDNGPGWWEFAKNYRSRERRFTVRFELQQVGTTRTESRVRQMSLFGDTVEVSP